MEVNEFAKFVVDNMGRATVGNALNIVNKLDNSEFYKFSEFVTEMQKYILTLINSEFDNNKCYAILNLINTTLTKYNSIIKYNKVYIINDFIIDLWRIMNGH